MKRKLSLLLALVMILSLVPMSAFAASTNTVDKTPKVADDHKFTDPTTAPQLRIEEKNNDEFGGSAQTFRLALENAEWLDTTTFAADMGHNPGNQVFVDRQTDTTVEITVYGNGVVGNNKQAWFFPMLAEAKSAGDLKVTVDPRDSSVSGGTYVFAVAADGATVASVASSKTMQRGNSQEGAAIVIDEANVGALGGTLAQPKDQEFRLKLPQNMTWDKTATENSIKLGAGMTLKSVSANDRTLTVVVTVNATSNVRRSITVTPFVNITKDAKYGDVTVEIDGRNDISDASGLVIGKYKDYGVSVEIKQVEEFFAGRKDDSYVTAKITIEETIANSLFKGRTMDFELPEWVKIPHDATIKKSSATPAIEVDEYGSKFEMTVPTTAPSTNSGKFKFELEIPLTIKADKAGDIALTIKGAGLETTELVVAKAIAPITAEIKLIDVKLGVQKQDAPEIIIKETVAGALKEKADLKIWFKDSDFGFRFDDAVFEVIDGDLEINEADAGKDSALVLIAPIKSESSKPSTIRVSGIQLTLDRTVPEGPFAIRVGGSALVENFFDVTTAGVKKDYYTKDFTSRVAQKDFANVINRAPGELSSTSKFVIDSKTYVVVENNVEIEKTMDIAPFIADGRTFLPIRYVAEALGVSEDNIIWNAATKTVTIMKGNRIAAMTIGSSVVTVNGTAIQMDTKAMIKDGRTVLPVRYVAQALGAQIDWNAETRTVTVTQ